MTEENKSTADSEKDKTETEGIVLNEVDRLKLENEQLRLMNMQKDYESLAQKLNSLEDVINKKQASYMAMLSGLADRYGFDPATTEMEPGTGRIVPRRGPQVPSPR